jgi:ribose transport system ATP-binding protein
MESASMSLPLRESPDACGILSLRGISKRFPGVQALSGVDLDIYAGECHALLGQNGAGKSTLVKILSGAQAPDEGSILLDRIPVRFRAPHVAQEAGIYTIHQELSLVPGLTVAENTYLSDLPGSRGLVRWAAVRRAAQNTLRSLGFDIDIDRRVGSLSIAEQQAVEIAKALHRRAKVLLLDEPTAALPSPDVDRLFRILRQLKASGVAILYISHRLDEVYEICDRVSVLRDGRHVVTEPVEGLTKNEAVRQMVGERLAQGLVAQLGVGGRRRLNPRPVEVSKQPVLEVRSLRGRRILQDVSLRVLPGEAVAVVGLIGSGQDELAACITGGELPAAGTIHVNGRKLNLRSPRRAIRAGLSLLPEDRKSQGLVLSMPITSNVTLASLRKVAWRVLGVLSRRAELRVTSHAVETVGVKAASLRQKVGTLSGGNQQKVVFSKWLAADANVLVFSEPTRGVDVGAKEEIYRAMGAFLATGKSAVVISSEIDEALMCDRIYVIAKGRIVAEFPHDAIDTDHLLLHLR